MKQYLIILDTYDFLILETILYNITFRYLEVKSNKIKIELHNISYNSLNTKLRISFQAQQVII